jgi:hypothetical protein
MTRWLQGSCLAHATSMSGVKIRVGLAGQLSHEHFAHAIFRHLYRETLRAGLTPLTGLGSQSRAHSLTHHTGHRIQDTGLEPGFDNGECASLTVIAFGIISKSSNVCYITRWNLQPRQRRKHGLNLLFEQTLCTVCSAVQMILERLLEFS